MFFSRSGEIICLRFSQGIGLRSAINFAISILHFSLFIFLGILNVFV